MSIYIKHAKFSLNYRQIKEHKADILVFPFTDLNFNVYPGNLINSLEVDYREKIEKKMVEGKLKCGDLYAQKCCGLPNFEIILFAWIDADPAKNYNNYSKMLDFAQKVIKSINKKTASMLIPYSAEMGEMKEVVRAIAASL